MATAMSNAAAAADAPLPPVEIFELDPASALATAQRSPNGNGNSGIKDANNIQMKIAVVGASGVGKTKLLNTFRGQAYTDTSTATIGIEFCPKYYKVQSPALSSPVVVCAQLWDTAGQERFASLTTTYYRGAVAAMVVFSLTDAKSFDKVEKYFAEAQEHSGSGNQMICVLVGNKVDLCPDKREVSTEQWRTWADDRNVLGFETSAKTGTDVNAAFVEIIRLSILRLLRKRLLTGASTAAGAALSSAAPSLPSSSRVISDDRDPKEGVVPLFDPSRGTSSSSSTPGTTKARPKAGATLPAAGQSSCGC